MFYSLIQPVPMATATSLPTVQQFAATGKASIYPSFHGNPSFLTPFPVQTAAGYPAVPTYNSGCNGTNSSFPHLQTSSYSSACNGSSIPHVPTTSTFSPFYSNHAEVNSHTINGLIQPVSLEFKFACILASLITYFLL